MNEKEKLQQRIQALQVITDAAIKYKTCNREQLENDLRRLKEELNTI